MKPAFVIDGDAHVLEVEEQIRAKAPAPWDQRPFRLPTPDDADRALFNTLGKRPRPYDTGVYLQDMDIEEGHGTISLS